jgi:hypothetical protein
MLKVRINLALIIQRLEKEGVFVFRNLKTLLKGIVKSKGKRELIKELTT